MVWRGRAVRVSSGRCSAEPPTVFAEKRRPVPGTACSAPRCGDNTPRCIPSICICAYMCVNVFICVCMCVYMCLHVCICTHMCVHVCTVYIHVYTQFASVYRRRVHRNIRIQIQPHSSQGFHYNNSLNVPFPEREGFKLAWLTGWDAFYPGSACQPCSSIYISMYTHVYTCITYIRIHVRICIH
jgi:hypothetical protein